MTNEVLRLRQTLRLATETLSNYLNKLRLCAMQLFSALVFSRSEILRQVFSRSEMLHRRTYDSVATDKTDDA